MEIKLGMLMIKWIENVNENNNDKNIINENIKININDIVRLLRTIIERNIENQIEIVNDKMNKNIKGINNKKLIRTIIGIFNWKDDRNIIGKNIKKY